MMICIAVSGLDSSQVRRLQTALAGHQLTLIATLPESAKRAAIAEADVLFGNVPAGWLDGAPRLQWVQLDSAGVDAYLKVKPAAGRPAVQLTNLSGFFDKAVAEAAVAGILAFYRQLPRLIAAQPQARWVKPEVEPAIRALDGNRVLLLGAGTIARRIEHVLRAFDAQVRCYARRPRAGLLHTAEELEAALGETDLLINTLPHTSDTAGFVNRARLEQLKPGAVVVNVGRGSTLDETALVALLDRGHLGGAVLDVTAVEPLPPESPLWRHPKVILTQHTGGRFPGEVDRKLDVFLENMRRLERGEPLQHLVAPERGY
ncbi:D-2-hydroxyacid dehydrogenase [Horticoccus sp. 23ND18S-11]|uniref:D-2-hydroxyacid dehydrogenase n=1 Tax=Horticoccus sp. 23ND18S-11 TaxID=3391832 RepID=UPI0039C95D41